MSDRTMRRVLAATLECGHEHTFALTDKKRPEVHCGSCFIAASSNRDEKWHTQTEELLRVSLAFAVPLWVQRFIDEKRTPKQVRDEAHRAGALISEQGDALMFRSKAEKSTPRTPDGLPVRTRRAGTAALFNALASGLAAASFQPGGVKAFGNHFESKPEWLEGKP